MAQEERTRGRTQTWPNPTGIRRSAEWRFRGLRIPHAFWRETLARWLATDTSPGRLVPWLPIAFGLGIVLYFSADQEPSALATLSLATFAFGLAVLVRRRPVAFPIALALATMIAGFAMATLKSASVAHPVLWQSAFGAEVSGFVSKREERERSDRIVVEVKHIDGRNLREAPERIRVSVRRGTAPPVGAYVTFKARLSTPLAPLRPGGYDFARDLWFQGIGATGFVLGSIQQVKAPDAPDTWIRSAALIESIRDGIDRRIRSSVPGDAGSIASALITGKRDAISGPVNEAMYVSSLAHVLSISGYHMAVVAGVVFFVVRGMLALIPVLAWRRPIKKWAAAAAIAAAAFYLVISGAEVATQRAFIMTAVVLGGILIDRPALTLRTLAVAALIVMMISPQAVVHPSFQMSFAATLALIAAYERGLPWAFSAAHTSLGARVALWGVREAAALVFASLVAGLATTLFAAYHFHRVAPYGVLANLIAMPLVSVIAMPAGLLALVALPFGFDGALWRLMGEGIDRMISVALWVTQLPGALVQIAAFGAGLLMLGTLGLVLLCLLRSPLRWSGALVIAVAVVLAVRTPRPDVYVSGAGDAVAVRGDDGRLVVMRSGTDTFAVREWLNADADPRRPNDPALREKAHCDPAGCIAHLADGSRIALAITPEAFEDDCVHTTLIVSRHTAPKPCDAHLADRPMLEKNGALTLTRTDGRWIVTLARTQGQQRPWMRAPPAAAASAPAAASSRQPTPDATPRPDDLEAGD